MPLPRIGSIQTANMYLLWKGLALNDVIKAVETMSSFRRLLRQRAALSGDINGRRGAMSEQQSLQSLPPARSSRALQPQPLNGVARCGFGRFD